MSYDGLLIDTVTLVTITVGKRNEKTEALIANVKCRIMRKTKLMKNMSGEEVLSFAKIFFKRTQTINNQMLVRMVGEDYDRPIITYSQPEDSVQIHHKEVWVS